MPEQIITHRTAEQMQRHRELQRKSGLTIASYCKREDINLSSWWYWRKRLVSRTNSDKHVTSHAQVSFLQLPTQLPEPQKIDLTLPNGARVSLPLSCEPVFLRQTIRMLSGLRPR